MDDKKVEHYRYNLTVLSALSTFFAGMLMSVVSRLSLYNDNLIGSLSTIAMIFFVLVALTCAVLNFNLRKIPVNIVTEDLGRVMALFIWAVILFLGTVFAILVNQLPEADHRPTITISGIVFLIFGILWLSKLKYR